MSETTSHRAAFMWPDNEAEVDLLQFSHLASSVVHLVRQPHLLPTTIGIFGDWGSGKSTLLRLVRKDLEKDPNCICIQFNAWLFEGYEDAKTALMGTILDAIEERITSDQTLLKRLGDKVHGLLKRVRWLRLGALTLKVGIPAVVGLPPLSFAAAASALGNAALDGVKNADLDKAKSLMKDDEYGDEVRRSVTRFRAEFEKLLADCEVAAVVVFVDDLDRCLPATTIGILEAIKLFLFVPRSAFILAADERLVQQAVRLHHPAAALPEADLGRDYLEKLVQIPVRIPRLTGDGIESYINLLFAQRHFPSDLLERVASTLAGRPDSQGPTAEGSVEVPGLGVRVPPMHLSQELKEDLAVAATIGRVLRVDIEGSPRRIKRFLNTLFLRLEIARARGLTLRKDALAKLMLLEYFRPQVFKQLAQLQIEQSGRPQELARAESSIRSSRGPITARQKTESVPGGVTEGVAGAASTGKRTPKTETGPAPSSPEVDAWLVDVWVRRWLDLEPSLADTDLSLYFTIAHDKIGVLVSEADTLSETAHGVLRSLLDPAKTVSVRRGLDAAKQLAPGDLAEVFSRVWKRASAVEGPDNPLLTESLIKLAGMRQELGQGLLDILSSLPDSRVPPPVPVALAEALGNGQHATAVLNLLGRWSASKEGMLKKMADLATSRLRSGST